MLVNEQDLKTLEEEPDGLAEDEDEDKRQQNKAALGVRRGFSDVVFLGCI